MKLHMVIIMTILITISIISITTLTTMTTIAHAQQAHVPSNTSSLTKTGASHTRGATSNIEQNLSKFITYQNSTYGIKIQYPSGWLYKGSNSSILQNESIQTVALFVPPKSGLHDIFESPIG